MYKSLAWAMTTGFRLSWAAVIPDTSLSHCNQPMTLCRGALDGHGSDEAALDFNPGIQGADTFTISLLDAIKTIVVEYFHQKFHYRSFAVQGG